MSTSRADIIVGHIEGLPLLPEGDLGPILGSVNRSDGTYRASEEDNPGGRDLLEPPRSDSLSKLSSVNRSKKTGRVEVSPRRF